MRSSYACALAAPFLLLSVHCGTAAPAGAGEGDESSAAPEAVASQGAAVTATCPGAYPSCRLCGANSCGQPCCAHEREGNLISDYVDDCYAWVKPSWQRKNAPGLICHLDTDKHPTHITFEINVAEPYEDVSCIHSGDAWKKYEKAQTDCSYWVAITDKADCERKVQNAVAAVAAQGYIPAFTEPDRDQCPNPRL